MPLVRVIAGAARACTSNAENVPVLHLIVLPPVLRHGFSGLRYGLRPAAPWNDEGRRPEHRDRPPALHRRQAELELVISC